MSMRVELVTDPDTGRPKLHYITDGHAVYTGPIQGHVTLADGTMYDVTPDVIEVASEKHAAEVAHHIGLRHEKEGHPHHAADSPFKYTPKKGKS